MSEEKEVLQEKKANKKLQFTAAVMIFAALFIVELYLMINSKNAYLIIGIIGVLILCIVYLITDIAFKMKNEKDTLQEREYENLFKSEKISYVMMKQSFLEMAEILEEVRENSAFPVEELVKAQKGTAKVTIQRSKENATAIMNSNDKVIEHILSLEKNMKEVNDLIKDTQKGDGNASLTVSEDIITMQKDILSSINEMQFSIKNEIAKMSESLEASISKMQSTASPVEVVEEIEISKEESVEEEIAIPEEESVEEVAIPEEESVEEVAIPEEESVEEVVVIPEEESVEEEITIPEETELEEEIVEIQAETNLESIIEEKPPMPDLSDPGHVMSPEEIAALLANM